MAYCPRCGKPTDETALFCRHCGTQFGTQSQPPNIPGQATAAATQVSEPKPSHGMGLSITSMVLGIAGIGLPALICGIVALKSRRPGRGMAIAGVVLGALSTVALAVVLLSTSLLLFTRKGAPGQTSLPSGSDAPTEMQMFYDARRYAEEYTERLEKLSRKAGELRSDPTMAANLAQFDSVYSVAQTAVTEIKGITDERAGRAKREEMDDMWRAMKRLLSPGGGYSDE